MGASPAVWGVSGRGVGVWLAWILGGSPGLVVALDVWQGVGAVQLRGVSGRGSVALTVRGDAVQVETVQGVGRGRDAHVVRGGCGTMAIKKDRGAWLRSLCVSCCAASPDSVEMFLCVAPIIN